MADLDVDAVGSIGGGEGDSVSLRGYFRGLFAERGGVPSSSEDEYDIMGHDGVFLVGGLPLDSEALGVGEGKAFRLSEEVNIVVARELLLEGAFENMMVARELVLDGAFNELAVCED